MRTAILLVIVLLAGCGTIPVPAGTVKEAVWTPCPVDVPERPVFPADTLIWDEDLWTIGTTLYADRQARQAYEIKLEDRLIGCTKK